jgi:hypothetical protein
MKLTTVILTCAGAVAAAALPLHAGNPHWAFGINFGSGGFGAGVGVSSGPSIVAPAVPVCSAPVVVAAPPVVYYAPPAPVWGRPLVYAPAYGYPPRVACRPMYAPAPVPVVRNPYLYPPRHYPPRTRAYPPPGRGW